MKRSILAAVVLLLITTIGIGLYLHGGRPTAVAPPEKEAPRLLFLMHGVMSDATAYLYFRGALPYPDVVMIDTLGSGASSAPSLDSGVLGPDGYSPTTLAHCALEALRRALLDRPPEVKVTLIGHSLSGLTILRMYGDDALRQQYQDVLAHVDSIVLLAPADVALTQMPPAMKSVLNLTPLKLLAADVVGELRPSVIRSVKAGMVDPRTGLKSQVNRTLEISKNSVKLNAQRNLILGAVPTKNNEYMDAAKGVDLAKFEKMVDPDKIDYWVKQYRYVTVPCLIIWGSEDPVLPVEGGQRLLTQLPNAWLRVLDRTKHSVMIEQPAACAQLVKDFLDKKLLQEPRFKVCAVDPLKYEAPPGTAADLPAEDDWLPEHKLLVQRANQMTQKKTAVQVTLVAGKPVNIAMYESKDIAATQPVADAALRPEVSNIPAGHR